MVTYPITFPSDVTVSQMRILPRNSVSRSMSKFSFSEQVYDFGGEAWQIEGALPLMTREVAESYVSFLFKLKGRYGTFLFPLPSTISEARGSWGGTPVVDGGSQTGNELNITGLPVSTSNVVRAGDYINLGSGANTKLYKVLDSADSDASGNATLNIWPSIKTAPSDGAAIIYQDVAVHLRLDGDTPIDIDTDKHYFLSFAAMEAL